MLHPSGSESQVFQFHKGTIRTQEQTVEPTQEKNFNSIKVRLEHDNYAVVYNSSVFQFHKGTIRTHPLHYLKY